MTTRNMALRGDAPKGETEAGQVLKDTILDFSKEMCVAHHGVETMSRGFSQIHSFVLFTN